MDGWAKAQGSTLRETHAGGPEACAGIFYLDHLVSASGEASCRYIEFSSQVNISKGAYKDAV